MRLLHAHLPAWLPCPAVKIIDLEGLSMRDVSSGAFKWWAPRGCCAGGPEHAASNAPLLPSAAGPSVKTRPVARPHSL